MRHCPSERDLSGQLDGQLTSGDICIRWETDTGWAHVGRYEGRSVRFLGFTKLTEPDRESLARRAARFGWHAIHPDRARHGFRADDPGTVHMSLFGRDDARMSVHDSDHVDELWLRYFPSTDQSAATVWTAPITDATLHDSNDTESRRPPRSVCGRPTTEPVEHAKSGGHPNPLPPDPLGAPIELIPPPEPATPGGGISAPLGTQSGAVGPAVRSAVVAFRVMHRLGDIGQSLNPLTYLAAGLLITLAFVVMPIGEVHSGLSPAQYVATSTQSPALAVLFEFLQWSWRRACAVDALLLRLQP